MAIVNNLDSQKTIQDSSFKIAGWCSIISAILFVPVIVIGILTNFLNSFLLLASLPFVLGAHLLLSYAYLYFKHFLNERYDTHNLDVIIIAQIVITLAMGGKQITELIFTALFPSSVFLMILKGGLTMLGFVLGGIINLIFGILLLGIGKDLSGLLRIYSIIVIVNAVFFISIILFPIGIITHLLHIVVLGMILLTASEKDEQVEFV